MIADEHIVEGCKAGKRKAYSMLYKKYASTMLGLCLRYSKNLQEAEDVLQEGFIKVFHNISRFRQEGSFEGWIRRIMINAAIDHYKSNLKNAFHHDIDELEEKIGSMPEEEGNYRDIEIPAERLMAMVQELPDGYRIVFNLFVMEGYSHKEIADRLQVTENTSKTQLLKARKALRKKLDSVLLKSEKINSTR
jgi:RNA polymerase sigma-70 factor (ECF subfamily)